jgi:hypothetical protein
VFRTVGIRTVLIGIDLLRSEGPGREKALRDAPRIHACDTTAAVLAGMGGLRRRSAVTIVAISSPR